MYYLGVMNTKNRKIFDYHENFEDQDKQNSRVKKNNLKKECVAGKEDSYYEKMNY